MNSSMAKFDRKPIFSYFPNYFRQILLECRWNCSFRSSLFIEVPKGVILQDYLVVTPANVSSVQLFFKQKRWALQVVSWGQTRQSQVAALTLSDNFGGYLTLWNDTVDGRNPAPPEKDKTMYMGINCHNWLAGFLNRPFNDPPHKK